MGGGVVGTARYCVLDRGVTLGLSGMSPAGRHVVAQQSRFKSCPPIKLNPLAPDRLTFGLPVGGRPGAFV